MTDSETKVLREDLELIQDTLNTIYHKSVLEDMLDGYKKLNKTVRYSKYTQNLKTCLDKVEAYLVYESEEE